MGGKFHRGKSYQGRKKAKLLRKAEFFRKLNSREEGSGEVGLCTLERYDASNSKLAAAEEVAVDAKLYISTNFLPNSRYLISLFYV